LKKHQEVAVQLEPSQIALIAGIVLVLVVVLRRFSTIKSVEPPTPAFEMTTNPVASMQPGARSALERAHSCSTSSHVEKYVRANIVDIAEENFPDDIGYQWEILRFAHHGALSYVEVEPSENAGYARFQFVFSTANEGSPDHIATYCFEEGSYYLLSTAPTAPGDLPRKLS
jgi:hypothetical protein